jgi:hypothetical protein
MKRTRAGGTPPARLFFGHFAADRALPTARFGLLTLPGTNLA